jgi:hypothetical protein
VTPDVAAGIEQMQGSGEPLAAQERTFFEPRFAQDLSSVRVHTDQQAASLSQRLHARAFTVGSDIAFNTGEYNPHTSDGQRILAHELTHVSQQMNGRVSRQLIQTLREIPSLEEVVELAQEEVSEAEVEQQEAGEIEPGEEATLEMPGDAAAFAGAEAAEEAPTADGGSAAQPAEADEAEETEKVIEGEPEDDMSAALPEEVPAEPGDMADELPAAAQTAPSEKPELQPEALRTVPLAPLRPPAAEPKQPAAEAAADTVRVVFSPSRCRALMRRGPGPNRALLVPPKRPPNRCPQRKYLRRSSRTARSLTSKWLRRR